MKKPACSIPSSTRAFKHRTHQCGNKGACGPKKALFCCVAACAFLPTSRGDLRRGARPQHERRSSRVGDVTPDDADRYLTACIDRFPGYVGNLSPAGEVMVRFVGPETFRSKAEEMGIEAYPGYTEEKEFIFSFDLKGLRDHCQDCGIHIHEGSTCEVANGIGAHWWDDRGGTTEDPWTERFGASYDADNIGETQGEFSMYNGFGHDLNKGRVVVVYDQESNVRIGCGVLMKGGEGQCNFLSGISDENKIDADSDVGRRSDGGSKEWNNERTNSEDEMPDNAFQDEEHSNAGPKQGGHRARGHHHTGVADTKLRRRTLQRKVGNEMS